MWSGIDKMTEKSPASVIHSTVEPPTSSFDSTDAASSAASITLDNNQPPQPSPTDAAANDREDATGDQTTDDITPAATADNESSPQTSKSPAEMTEGEATHHVDKLKLSTLKELTVVSIFRPSIFICSKICT